MNYLELVSGFKQYLILYSSKDNVSTLPNHLEASLSHLSLDQNLELFENGGFLVKSDNSSGLNDHFRFLGYAKNLFEGNFISSVSRGNDDISDLIKQLSKSSRATLQLSHEYGENSICLIGSHQRVGIGENLTSTTKPFIILPSDGRNNSDNIQKNYAMIKREVQDPLTSITPYGLEIIEHE